MSESVEVSRTGFRLFRVAGIQIRIDYSWFIIFFLVVFSLSAGYLPDRYPGSSPAAYWLAGAAATVLFFLSILLHELAHSLVALRSGIHIPDITLFLFGGVSRLSEDAKDPGTEFKVAAVGPLTSFALGGLFWLAATRLPLEPGLVEGVMRYLAWINVALGIFNLIPGYPLDGGRILRAAWWWRTRSLLRATRVASEAGKGFGVFLMLLGAGQIFFGGLLGGVWLIFIGMFLRGTAVAGYQELVIRRSIEGMRVRDVELEGAPSVAPDATVRELVNDYFLRYGYESFPVGQNGSIQGLITLDAVKQVPEPDRDRVRVREIMRGLRDEDIVRPDTSLIDTLGRLGARGRLLVVEERDRSVQGALSGRELVRLLEVHRALST
jgi:Zn-dependent protease